MSIADNHYIVVMLERPQKNSGAERIADVIEYDENHNEVKSYPELTYQHDYFEEDFNKLTKDIQNDIAPQLDARQNQIRVTLQE